MYKNNNLKNSNSYSMHRCINARYTLLLKLRSFIKSDDYLL